jgi:hypothetical protein
LRRLRLARGRLTDEALKAVAQFPDLRSLVLANEGFTDAGIAYLSQSKSLSELEKEPSASGISDAAIQNWQRTGMMKNTQPKTKFHFNAVNP